MSSRPEPADPGAAHLLRTRLGVLAALACVGVWLLAPSSDGVPAGPPLPAAAERAPAGPGVWSDTVAPLPGAVPTRVRIPSVGVDTPLIGLGLAPDGRVDSPPPGRTSPAGWYRDGTPPGSAGTAVVAGHVDHASGPAVFHRLGAVRRGASVEVRRRDGRTAVFTVHAVEFFDARSFPDARVYGPSERAELRVITCGGSFAPGVGYQGNVVVFAHLTGTY
ncbi:class F sortase [Streptomyces sp. BI20]|uniref:class F sortase n=1 Tax=Streptomyces sp. BI20 TaxID=3403460 RepID=UPI003C7880AD